MTMTKNKALGLYLAGAFGQMILVCTVVFFLRRLGLKLDYTTPSGMVAIAVGGISTALWGAILSVKYRGIKTKTIFFDFFRFKQNYKDYLLLILFLFLDFLPVFFGGGIEIAVWYLPIVLFLKALVFGGIEEIGWRYFFQPVLQKKINYFFATLLTFIAWGIWHFLYFYVEGSLSSISVLPFLLGLLTNSFILSALFVKSKNLWMCVLAHSLINVFSQLALGENMILSFVCKALIVAIAIMVGIKEKGSYISDVG